MIGTTSRGFTALTISTTELRKNQKYFDTKSPFTNMQPSLRCKPQYADIEFARNSIPRWNVRTWFHTITNQKKTLNPVARDDNMVGANVPIHFIRITVLKWEILVS